MYPVLFRTPVLEVAATTGTKLAELVYLEAHRSPGVFTDGETPYTHFKRFTGKPLITLNRVGRDAFIYIAAGIGQEIATRQDPWLKRLMGQCIHRYAPKLAIEAVTPPGTPDRRGEHRGGAPPFGGQAARRHRGARI
jgi:hypothetical protein